MKKDRIQVANLKLKRKLREISETKISTFNVALDQASYDRWVLDVNQKISKINQAIRESNKR